MRFIISLIIVAFSAFLGITRYQYYAEKFKKSDKLFRFCRALSENNKTKMEGFCTVCNEVLGGEKTVDSTTKALDYIRKNYSDVSDFEKIYALLTEFTTCGKSDIEDKSEKLVEWSKIACEKQKTLLNTSGRSALVLFPGIALMILILLI